jgi:NAD(P)-dependent dehydrogenase (short-subunit alcohol dehydrogenase family)
VTGDSTIAEIEAAGLALESGQARVHDGIEAMVTRVVQERGRVDAMVTNAGGGRGQPIDTNLSDYVTGAVIPIDGGLVRG